MHNWAVSLVSVDLSNCSEKHLQFAMSLYCNDFTSSDASVAVFACESVKKLLLSD